MKEDIHPEYGDTRFECACGNVFETKSTRTGKIKVDICSACHPFFTGGQRKLVDSEGRVERFYRKYGKDLKKNKKKS